jgi:hypothetical protein
MLFSPYFPIRFKGVFMAYLYMHIPQIFPTGFFRGIQAYSCIDLKEDSIKGECYETVSVPNIKRKRISS